MASDCVLGSRRRDVATGDYQFGWLQGVRNLLRQNSFWLQRPDLNQRTWEEEPVLTRQALYELDRQSQTMGSEPLIETKVPGTVVS